MTTPTRKDVVVVYTITDTSQVRPTWARHLAFRPEVK